MKFKYGQKVQTIDTLGFYPTGTIISIYVKYNKTILNIQLDSQYGNMVILTVGVNIEIYPWFLERGTASSSPV